jgi:hypothetical protein
MPKVIKSNRKNIHRFELAHGEIKDTEQPPVPLNSVRDKHNLQKRLQKWSLFLSIILI